MSSSAVLLSRRAALLGAALVLVGRRHPAAAAARATRAAAAVPAAVVFCPCPTQQKQQKFSLRRAFAAPSLGYQTGPGVLPDTPELPETAPEDGWQWTTSPEKESTGITGLVPEPFAREKLFRLYIQMLKNVQVMEEGSPYRVLLEKHAQYRTQLIREIRDIPKLEKVIGGGQIEELIARARDELSLIPMMAEWRPWEHDPDLHGVPVIAEFSDNDAFHY